MIKNYLGRYIPLLRGLPRRGSILFVGPIVLIAILLLVSMLVTGGFRMLSPSQLPVSTPLTLPTSPFQQFTPTASSLANSCKQAYWPKYDPLPRADLPKDSDHIGDLTYGGGPVIDGVANLYLIFWIDTSFQSPTHTYVSLMKQFVQDIGRSSLYANLLQYHDARGLCPTGAQLAGTFTDTQPFPQDLVALRNNPNVNSNVMDRLTDQMWKQEIEEIAAKKGWNTQDYHNVFILLPSMSWGCGWHSFLSIDGLRGSPYIYGSYPYYKGRESCTVVPQSPNHDHVADIATGIVSHELMEAVSDPYPGSGWNGAGNDGEMADKCPLPPNTIDPKTNGNVVWYGHAYALQEEYDNFRHGCVLEGP